MTRTYQMNPPLKAYEVVPATRHHKDLIAALFGTSRGVSECWCMWPLRPPRTHLPDHSGNKAEMTRRLDAGETPGLLALFGGVAVGWCALGPRERYPQYTDMNSLEGAWAIPCIYIDRSENRRSVAQALIKAAISIAREKAATCIEGPPPWWLPGDAAAIAEATAIFTENGFERVGPGARMPELRLEVGIK